jgi:hypothetical protein
MGQKGFGLNLYQKTQVFRTFQTSEEILTINIPLILKVRDFMFFPTKKHKIPNF